MLNNIIFLFHTAFVCLSVMLMLRLGKVAIIALLSLLAVMMNLFILKQATLFHLEATCCDPLVIGYILGLNLFQEFFGRKETTKVVGLTFLTTLLFLGFSSFHLLYQPNCYDLSNPHYSFILSAQTRIILASLASFMITQIFDLTLFGYLKGKFQGRFLPLRTTFSLCCSQILDTFCFTYLGLYGMINNPMDIICLSLIIKGFVILLTIPFVLLTKKITPYAKFKV